MLVIHGKMILQAHTSVNALQTHLRTVHSWDQCIPVCKLNGTSVGFILSHNIASLTYRSVTVEHGLCKVDPKHVPLLPAQERSASLTAITAIDKEDV